MNSTMDRVTVTGHVPEIYFSYGCVSNEQREGATMGSCVSVVVANLYMEFFKELAL